MPSAPGRRAKRGTKDDIVAAIRAEVHAGRAVNNAAIAKRKGGLLRRAIRLFGSWDEALRAAGLEPRGIRLTHRLSREEVLMALRERAGAKRSLRIAKVLQENGVLVRSAWREFGSWRRAVREAGCDPALGRPIHWTPEELVALFRRIHRRRGFVSFRLVREVRRPDRVSPIYSVWRHFGSFGRAKEIAGTPEDGRSILLTKWTRERIILEISSRVRRGDSIRMKDVRRSQSGLFCVAEARFGGWRAAVEAAGFGPLLPKPLRSWSRAEVVEAIRKRRREGLSVTSGAVQREDCALYHAAEYWVGSWRGAVEAAGLRYEPLIHPWWTGEEVLATVRRLHSGGSRVRGRRFRSQNRGLFQAGRRKFGSWRAVLLAAGVEAS